MKILVIQQKMIGDVLTASILFEAIKQKYPKAELHYLINSHTYPVVENNPFIDEFVFFTPEVEKSKRKLWQLVKKIRKENYDAIIDVYGKLSSNLISLFSKSQLKIGHHKKQSSFIYTHALKRKKISEHNTSLAIENRMLLLEPFQIKFKNYTPTIYLKEVEKQQAKSYLESRDIKLDKPLFMISVLGSSLSKTYPFNYMAKLLDTIVDRISDSQLLFNYIPKQLEDARAIYEACQPKTQDQIFFDVYGKSLREFLAITSHCSAMIGNEGGANNMTKALGIPTFTIFSPQISKKNWHSESEGRKHVAVHLSDYITYTTKDKKNAKKNPETYYLKLKPELILPQLNSFLSNFQ